MNNQQLLHLARQVEQDYPNFSLSEFLRLLDEADHGSDVTELTRRSILKAINGTELFGDLPLVDQLSRLWQLREMPGLDFDELNLAESIFQHLRCITCDLMTGIGLSMTGSLSVKYIHVSDNSKARYDRTSRKTSERKPAQGSVRFQYRNRTRVRISGVRHARSLIDCRWSEALSAIFRSSLRGHKGAELSRWDTGFRPTTNTPRPIIFGWPFLLWNPACSRGFVRGSCGLRGSAIRPCFPRLLLSPGGFSLRVAAALGVKSAKAARRTLDRSYGYERTSRAV